MPTENGLTLYTAGGDVINFQSDIAGLKFQNIKPGLTAHKNIEKNGDNELVEKVGGSATRIFEKTNGIYRLSAIDFKELGRVNVERDKAGKLKSIANQNNTLKIDFNWSKDGALSSLEDSAGRTVVFSYAGEDLIQWQDVVRAKWSVMNDVSGIASITDPCGTVALNVKYANSRVSETTSIAGHFQYDYELYPSGYVSNSKIRCEGTTEIRLAHNLDGQLVSLQSEKNSVALSLEYDELGNRVSMSRGEKKYQYTYNKTGQLTSIDNGKYRRSWDFDDSGTLIGTADAAGSTTYQFDQFGQVIAAQSDRKVRTYTAVREGGKLSEIQGKKHSRRFKYTDEGRLAQVDSSYKNSSATYAYDKAGAVISEKMANRYRANATRDAKGLLLEFSDSLGRQFSFQRDARGALTKIINTAGEWAQAVRDARGRISLLTNSFGQARNFVYGASGELIRWIDAKQRTFDVEYDSATGKATRMMGADGTYIARGENGEALLFAYQQGGSSTVEGVPFEDEWKDPLFGFGFFGSFSGLSQYFVAEATKSSGDPTTTTVAPMLMAYSTTDYGGDGILSGDPYVPPPPPPPGDTDSDDTSDSGDSGIGIGDGSGPGDTGDSGSASCDACTSSNQQMCQNTLDAVLQQAFIINTAADVSCALVAATVVLGLACIVVAEAAYQAAQVGAQASYDNCVMNIPNVCYARCQ